MIDTENIEINSLLSRLEDTSIDKIHGSTKITVRDANLLNLVNLQTIYMLKTCICKVALYKTVGTTKFHFYL